MYLRKLTMASFFVVGAFTTHAQQTELLKDLPQTKEQFISSEKNVLATISWLENTPLNQETDKHKEQYALLTAWLTNSPTVTIEINADFIKFADNNSEMLMMFMAGWTRYALQHNYSTDTKQGNLAGIRFAAKVYKANDLKKDKAMQKLIEMDEKGELEKWVGDKLAKSEVKIGKSKNDR